MKKEVELNNAKWLVEPGCVVLVTSGTLEKPNVMTFAGRRLLTVPIRA